RQKVDLAYADSNWLNPQCGQSALIFSGCFGVFGLAKEGRDYRGSGCGAGGRELSVCLMSPLTGVTSDLPTKVLPSAMATRATLRSPWRPARPLSSQRSSTVILPCTFPNTVTDLVLISPRISAFSPTVSTPADVISPSTLPSM